VAWEYVWFYSLIVFVRTIIAINGELLQGKGDFYLDCL
jgi:hypothetical protein